MEWFIEGECRTQTIMMPESLDDYVSEINPVRVVDVFIDELDLFKLGFSRAEPELPAVTEVCWWHPAHPTRGGFTAASLCGARSTHNKIIRPP